MEYTEMDKVIQNIVDEIKQECIIENTAIRDDIFGILENQCTVVYFPIEDQKNRGFHIKKLFIINWKILSILIQESQWQNRFLLPLMN